MLILWCPDPNRTLEPSQYSKVTLKSKPTDGTVLSLTFLCGGHRCSLGHDRHLWLGPLLLRNRCGGVSLLLGLHDADVVGQGLLGANLAAGVPGQHDLHLDAEHT